MIFAAFETAGGVRREHTANSIRTRREVSCGLGKRHMGFPTKSTSLRLGSAASFSSSAKFLMLLFDM